MSRVRPSVSVRCIAVGVVGVLLVCAPGCDDKQPKRADKFPIEPTNSATVTPVVPQKANPTNTLTPAPLPLSNSQLAAATFNVAIAGLATNRFAPAWHALPESYRQDLQGLAQLAGQFIDDATHTKAVGVLKIATTVLPKKRVLLQQWTGAAQPAELNSTAAGYLRHADEVFAVAVTLANSDLVTLAWRNNPDVGIFLGGIVPQLLPQLEQLLLKVDPQNPYMRQFKQTVKTLKVEPAPHPDYPGAALKVSFGTNTQQVFFRTVEGKWVPEELAQQWPALVVGWRKELNTKLADKVWLAQFRRNLVRTLDAIESALEQLDQTQSPRQAALIIGGLGTALSQPVAVRIYPARERLWVYGVRQNDAIDAVFTNQQQEILLQFLGFPDMRRPSRDRRADEVWTYTGMKVTNRLAGNAPATRVEFALKNGVVIFVQVAP